MKRGHFKFLFPFAFGILCLLFLACGNPDAICVPQSTQACTCSNNQQGTQTCDEKGEAWSACECSPTGEENGTSEEPSRSEKTVDSGKESTSEQVSQESVSGETSQEKNQDQESTSNENLQEKPNTSEPGKEDSSSEKESTNEKTSFETVPSENDDEMVDENEDIAEETTDGDASAVVEIPVPTCSDGATRPCFQGSTGCKSDGSGGFVCEGQCQAGKSTCTSGKWGACVGDVSPTTEICDGKDNDCDGEVDEDFADLGKECVVGKGECENKGKTVCSTDGSKTVCDAKEGTATTETCDGKDNDCDGQVDEDYVGIGDKCSVGKGECKNEGKNICTSDGTNVECSVKAGTATTEVCDGKDNDCDGQTDEDFTDLGKECAVGKGECENKGKYICSTDGSKTVCDAKEGTATAEICDGKDNNCDGSIDESLVKSCYSGTSETKGKGLCQDGTSTCSQGSWGTCIGEIKPATEVCDGKDNDCDGEVDEDFADLGKECVVGKGECENKGKTVCSTDGSKTVCDAKEGTANKEVCDGKDNDCDGQTDEDFTDLGKECVVGKGECENKGKYICSTDGSNAICDVKPKASTKEACDGKDNDCDGQTDEDFTDLGQACIAGKGECRASGKFVCHEDKTKTKCDGVPTSPGTEVCDWKDNDCDGKVDEEGVCPRARRKIVAGYAHTCFLLKSDWLRCWGDNQFGQLGDGTTTSSKSPVEVKGLSNISSVVAGNNHTCVVLRDGTVQCWGSNGHGQLGRGTTSNYEVTPAQVQGLTGVKQLALGDQFSCALLNDKTVKCWGRNHKGQLGNGTKTNANTPVAVKNLKDVYYLAVGYELSCALWGTYKMSCWGSAANHLMLKGNGRDVLTPEEATNLHLNNFKLETISLGYNHACAVDANQAIQCWGPNYKGQIGQSNTNTIYASPRVPRDSSKSLQVGIGEEFSCAVQTDRKVRCWGNNKYGQLGDGTRTQRLKATLVASSLSVDSIAVGAAHVCAMLKEGGVLCWGNNGKGRLGDGTDTERIEPVFPESYGKSLTCSADVKLPRAELCDGKDNDCDGKVDNQMSSSDGIVRTCINESGECSYGTQTCKNGQWQACSIKSVTEVCDNKDNDCDGLADEDIPNRPGTYSGPAGTENVGKCKASYEYCISGRWRKVEEVLPQTAYRVNSCPPNTASDGDCDGKLDTIGSSCTDRDGKAGAWKCLLGQYIFCAAP